MANVKYRTLAVILVLLAISQGIVQAQTIKVSVLCEPGSEASLTNIGSNEVEANCTTHTPTPIATSTATPTHINTPVKTPVAYENWPLCLTHDITEYHGLADYERECHYDHTHGDDPNREDLVAIFGPHSGKVSYPWATLNENELKHEGYFFLGYGRGVIPISPYVNWLGGRQANYISAARIQFHFMPNHMDAAVRNHSYYMEVESCSVVDSTKCFIFKTGGHWSTGLLHCPYKEKYCPLPGDTIPPNYWIPGTPTSGKSIDPYRAHLKNGPQLLKTLAGFPQAWDPGFLFITDNTNFENVVFWTSAWRTSFGTNKLAGFGISNFDNVVYTDPDKAAMFGIPGSVDFANHLFYNVCDAAPANKKETCRFDGTEFALINAWVAPVNMNPGTYYTDIYGNLNTANCNQPTANCVPLIVEGTPLQGWNAYNFSETKWPNGKTPGLMRDFNNSPKSKQWITAYEMTH